MNDFHLLANLVVLEAPEQLIITCAMLVNGEDVKVLSLPLGPLPPLTLSQESELRSEFARLVESKAPKTAPTKIAPAAGPSASSTTRTVRDLFRPTSSHLDFNLISQAPPTAAKPEAAKRAPHLAAVERELLGMGFPKERIEEAFFVGGADVTLETALAYLLQ